MVNSFVQTKGKEKNLQGKRKRKEVRSTEEIMERRNLVSTTGKNPRQLKKMAKKKKTAKKMLKND